MTSRLVEFDLNMVFFSPLLAILKKKGSSKGFEFLIKLSNCKSILHGRGETKRLK